MKTMNRQITTGSTGTRAASFRISEERYREFVRLLQTVPGSDVGSMYREIFTRGLRSLQAFYGLAPQDGPLPKGGQP